MRVCFPRQDLLTREARRHYKADWLVMRRKKYASNIQSFFQVSEAELFRQVGDFVNKVVRERDLPIHFELGLPVLGVEDPFIPIRIIKLAVTQKAGSKSGSS